MTHDNGAFDKPRSFTLFRAYDAFRHGWYINGDLMAYKDGLTVTAHGLYGLVKEHGWRGAERVIIQYGRPRR